MTTTRKPRQRATPDAVREDSVGRDVLEARIGVIELAVSRQPGMTPEKMAEQKPGGVQNRDTSATGLLTYLCWLHSQYASGPKAPSTAPSLRWDGRAMDDLRAAMAREPIHVTLESGRKVGVYPKGEAALNRLAVNQLALGWATGMKLGLLDVEPPTSASLEALRDATRLETFLQAEFVAIVTDPTPYLPWEDAGGWEHPVPAWTTEVSPLDLLAIRSAYLDVNVHRINAIAERTRQFSGAGDAMPLAAFLGVMTDEFKAKPEDIAKKYSLGEIFAVAFAKYEATERAKARAEREKPTP